MAVPPVVMIVPLFVLYTQLGLISTYQGNHPHLCRAHHALLGLSPDHLLPHRAEGTVRIGAHRRRGAFPHSHQDRPAAVASRHRDAGGGEFALCLERPADRHHLLQDDAKRTLMAGISVFQGRYNNQVPLTMAGMVIASAPCSFSTSSSRSTSFVADGRGHQVIGPMRRSPSRTTRSGSPSCRRWAALSRRSSIVPPDCPCSDECPGIPSRSPLQALRRATSRNG